MNDKHLITICARGGSKGIPNKNIKDVNGIPLIAYTINTAKKLAKKLNADIILSTDSAKIKAVSDIHGIYEEYARPAELAKDNTGKIDVLYHALKYKENNTQKSYDYLIDLDVSSPLRNVKDVLEANQLLRNREEALNIFSVSEARKNPYFNMVERNEKGFYELSKSGDTPFTRQSAKKVWELNASFYIYRKAFFEQDEKSAITAKSLAYPVDHICFDIDDILELYFLEFLLKEDKLDFKL